MKSETLSVASGGYLPILRACTGEIGVTLMDRDKCWLFLLRLHPHLPTPLVPCSKWLRRNWWETVAGKKLCKLLSSLPTFHLCCSSAWAQERGIFFFSASFWRDDRHTDSRVDGYTVRTYCWCKVWSWNLNVWYRDTLLILTLQRYSIP